MTQTIAELVEASKALPIDDRIELVHAIWDTIPSLPEGWKPSEAAMAEIRRRRDEHVRDPGSAVTAEEMRARLSRLRTSL